MRELVDFLVRSLVEHPDRVEVEEFEEDEKILGEGRWLERTTDRKVLDGDGNRRENEVVLGVEMPG